MNCIWIALTSNKNCWFHILELSIFGFWVWAKLVLGLCSRIGENFAALGPIEWNFNKFRRLLKFRWSGKISSFTKLASFPKSVQGLDSHRFKLTRGSNARKQLRKLLFYLWMCLGVVSKSIGTYYLLVRNITGI